MHRTVGARRLNPVAADLADLTPAGEPGFPTGTRRLVAAGVSVASALVLIAFSSVLLTHEAGEITLGAVLLDRGSSIYPFTIQNLMWVVFAVGIGETVIRLGRGSKELEQLGAGLLPEDAATMLRAPDLATVYDRVRPRPATEQHYLQRLIARVVLQFQAGRSVEQANSLLNSSLELLQHEIELKYTVLRYLVWVIPTLGFIGTVVGIALALGEAGDIPDLDDADQLQPWMQALTGRLGLAFNTTLLALLLSAVLVLLTHVAQQREESALNRSGQYCLDNLINRLYEK